MLAIFGRWLFEAVMTDTPGMEAGTAIACSTLCKIFLRQEPEEFLQVHLASFYVCLSKILVKPINDKVIVAALRSTKKIFSFELKGSYVLVPYYFVAFSTTWSSNMLDPSVRSAVIDIIGTLICLGDHFKDVTIPLKQYPSIQYSSIGEFPVIKTFGAGKPHLMKLLVSALAKEETTKNIERILWCIPPFMLSFSNEEFVTHH